MPRPAPPPTPRAAEYWRSGADGVLRIARCGPCGTYIHPPRPLCPQCHPPTWPSRPSAAKARCTPSPSTATSGRRRSNPHVLAEVDLAEQPGLRLLTAVVGCPVDAVRIGMPVTVAFEPAGDSAREGNVEHAGDEPDTAWIPVFRP
ncbi:Zn-ribbon domain-containing OB-fold protein [Yinghuangia aomiensis]